MSWLLGSAFGVPRYVWVVLAIGFLVGTIGLLRSIERADDRANQEIGRVEQREGDLREVLERVEIGNATREEVERDVGAGNGTVLYEQCLRTARTPANCQRFMPD